MTDSAIRTVQANVNGQPVAAVAPVRKLLSDFLREDLSLTGTHVGCEHGACGACTVLLDGRPVRSCLMLAVQIEGRSVTTIEGVSGPGGALHPVQRAFHEQHALQCGYCTAGFIINTIAFLSDRSSNPEPLDVNEIREELSGVLCRCTGYTNILRAIAQAATELGIEVKGGGL